MVLFSLHRNVVSETLSTSRVMRAEAHEVSHHRGVEHETVSAAMEEATSEPDPADPLPIIMRATNGKGKARRTDRIKIRTVVQPAELDGFFTRYAEICKARMQGLKKRDKSKKKRAKRRKRHEAEA